jgi:alkanesulfonate monooxygenase SsuD/methylene tetrahydromethanopterin reductase-like flavin-dependent oxidoreductase (luciferase family)
MLHLKKDYLVFKLPCLVLMASVFVWLSAATGASWTSVNAQNRSARAAVASADSTKGDDEPLFSAYKGVQIGMTTDEARKKLGEPQDKSDEQDFFVFNEKESAQVFYDKTHKTYAVSINYLGAGNSTPMPKAVLGSEIEAKPDGSMYRMVRYRKAGYWVSYSRTAGTDPLITVTMQRID